MSDMRANLEKNEQTRKEWFDEYLNSPEKWQEIVKYGQSILNKYGVPESITSGETLAQLAGIALDQRFRHERLAKSVSHAEFKRFVHAYLRNHQRDLHRHRSAKKRGITKAEAIKLDIVAVADSDTTEMWEWAVERISLKISDPEVVDRLLKVLSLRWGMANDTEIRDILGLSRRQLDNARLLLERVFSDLVEELQDKVI